MGVPTSGNFSMFGSSDTSTIQGAVKQAGANSQINGANTFSQIISLSNVSAFNPTYSGNLSGSLSNVTNALQYRGYPLLESTTLCYDTYNPNTACNCGNSNTYYLISGTGNGIKGSPILATNSSGSSAAAQGWYAVGGAVHYWNGSNAWGVDSSGNTRSSSEC